MIIGLWDADFMKYKQPIYNLELMKLATYHKQHRDIVKLAPVLEPERYSKFYFRKDWDDGDYPKKIFLSNVVYGGRAFGNRYKPLSEEIELSIPDTHIYEEYSKWFMGNQLESFNIMKNAAHIRLSLDGTTLWKDYSKAFTFSTRTKSFILHDYDLNLIPNSAEIIQDIISSDGSKIPRFVGMKFPVQVSCAADLARWLKLPGAQLYYSIQYNGIMDKSALDVFLTISKAQSRNLDYMVTVSSSGEDDFIMNKLPEIYKQLLICQMHNKRISLKYEDDFFQDRRWADLLEYLNEYNRAEVERQINVKKTLYYFTKHAFKNKVYASKIGFSRDYVAELFQMVRERNYDLFKMFYESTGGDFYDTNRNP